MKIIFLQSTLELIAQEDPQTANTIISNGIIKTTKNNINYLLLNN